MKVLARFFIIVVLFFFTYCFLYSIIPFFSLVFFGSFKAVSSCLGYTFFFTLFSVPVLIALFTTFLNADLTVKN